MAKELNIIKERAKAEAERENRQSPLVRISYLTYLPVLVAAVLILYFAIWKYAQFQKGFEADDTLQIIIERNEVAAVGDEMMPAVEMTAKATKAAKYTIDLESEDFRKTYDSGKRMREYTIEETLPRSLFGRQITVSATATDEKGVVLTQQMKINAKKEPDVLIQVG